MKILTLVMFLVSFSSSATSDLGKWGTSCDEDGFSIKVSEVPSALVINDNQIVIATTATQISDNEIDVFFNKTLDLGKGGMNFKWDEVNKSKKIAKITFSGGEGVLKWEGFFNKKTNSYFWVSDPDFVQSYAEAGVIKMKKCN